MSVKTSAPVLGFNHNLKFGPRIYHVQTEDSGLPHAHYITHLFVGGNILASMKTSYAEQAEDPELQKTIRGLMETQHKQMVRRLVAGEFNEKVEQFAPHYDPGVLASGQMGPAAVNQAPSAPAFAAAQISTEPTVPKVKPPPSFGKPLPPPSRPAPHKPVAPAPPRAPSVVKTPPQRAPSMPVPPPSVRPPPAQQPSILKAPVTPAGPSRMPGAPLPETIRLPPTQLPMQKPPVVSPARKTPPPAAPQRVAAPPQPPPAPLSQNPFAFEEPEILEEAQIIEAPTDNIPTLFAEELISEKSLDEVILAFLSADLEQPK